MFCTHAVLNSLASYFHFRPTWILPYLHYNLGVNYSGCVGCSRQCSGHRGCSYEKKIKIGHGIANSVASTGRPTGMTVVNLAVVLVKMFR